MDTLNEKKFDALVILGGAIIENTPGHWRTTLFNEGDNFGVSGDRMRVLAAVFLYKNHRCAIIASGGKGQLLNAPSGSEVLKKELLAKDVLLEDIIEENASRNTYEELKYSQFLLKKEWENIALISNNWHLPRVKAMIAYLPQLKALARDTRIELIGAEDILLAHQKNRFKQVFENAYASEEMKKRIMLEQKGIRDIKKGLYKLSPR